MTRKWEIQVKEIFGASYKETLGVKLFCVIRIMCDLNHGNQPTNLV